MDRFLQRLLYNKIQVNTPRENTSDKTKVVVIGSGYAGVSAIQEIEKRNDGSMNIQWISDVDHHLVLHESHRCISDPSTKQKIRIPVQDIKSDSTKFTQGRVESIENGDNRVRLEDGKSVNYDYLVVSVGSKTSFFGIDGLRENALTLKSLEDALEINQELLDSHRVEDRPRVVIGGGGLTGIQIAGEVKELQKDLEGRFDTHIIEGMNSIYPGNPNKVQNMLKSKLFDKNVQIHTGNFVEEADSESVRLDNGDDIGYDVLIWAGGIEGQECGIQSNLEVEDRTNRIRTQKTLQSYTDSNVFVTGDAGYIDYENGQSVPPKAQAAWDSGEVIAKNVINHINGKSLNEFDYNDQGTAISVGKDAVAHGLDPIPFVDTLQGRPAVALKKSISSQWISSVTNPKKGMQAWSKM